MGKVRHSKFRNTAILFELLTRQITADVLNGNDKSKALRIVKECFGEKTELKKELELYNILVAEKFNNEDKANYFITAVIKSRRKLSEKKLKSERYNLVKEIKESYPITEFFRSRIDNYTVLASISKIFENVNDDSPADITRARYSIVEHITSKNVKKDKTVSKIVESYQKQEKDLRLLAYKLMVDKFNEKYKDLSSKQKKLLSEYINNVSNTNSLREYVNKECDTMSKKLEKLKPFVKDKVTRIKLNEVTNQIDKVKRGQIVKEKQVVALLRYYQLYEELKEVLATLQEANGTKKGKK